MKKKLIVTAGLLTATFFGGCLQQEDEQEGSVAALRAPVTRLEFRTWQGEIKKSTAAKFAVGAPSALLLEGPDARGRYSGEWRQMGCGNVSVTGQRMTNGSFRLIGTDVTTVCRETGPGALNCLLQSADGSAAS